MSGLHARLLARIDGEPDAYAEWSAIRAVIELHAFRPCENAARDNHPLPGNCAGCDPLNEDSCQTNPWPCPTIQTIARELGVEP